MSVEDDIIRIERCCSSWEPLLDLPGVTVQHVYLETYSDEHTVCADTQPLWQYRTAKIRWYMPAIARLTDAELEVTVVHEYVHILLGPVQEHLLAKHGDLLEMVTENVARALIRTYMEAP